MNNLPIMLSAIVAFVATISAGIFIKKFKNNIGVVCAFAAGFFIALALFDILPNISSLAFEAQIPYTGPLIVAFAGFFLLFAIDHGFSRFQLKGHSMMAKFSRPRIGLLSTIEFCSHGFIEGLAIGVSFQLELSIGVLVAIAVVSHDFCDGISTLALMLNSGNTMKSSLSMLFIDASAPVLGAVTTLLLTIQSHFLAFALSFLAGSFLYMGAGSLLPDAYKMNRPITTLFFFLTGFFIILVLTKTVG